ncbi:MAG: MXAN_5187 C-terminal domain-containing protein [Deltaproteobacteria bacterium]
MALPPKRPGGQRAAGSQDPLLPERETGKEKLASEQLASALDALEEELEEIKVKYEMYFMGADRMEPSRRRDDLKRNVERLRSAFTRNAGIRFRIQTLHARYLSYERLWLRSGREKEAGTYRRDVMKVRRKMAEARGQKVEAAPVAKPAAPPPPPPAPASVLGDAELRDLFDSYVSAKRSCNEDVSRLTLESIARTVNKQAPEIAAKYKAKRVEFKVVVRDGRAVLTAVPRS